MADDMRYPSEMVDRLEDDKLHTRLVTEEELQLLNPKHHYVSYYVNVSGYPKYMVAPSNATENDTSLKSAWKTVSYPLVVIREAYLNLREEEPQILKVLNDKPRTLMYCIASFRSMKEYTCGLREILESFYQNTCVQAAGFLKPSSPKKFRFTKGGHTNRGSERNCDILLFLSEILGILLGNDQSEVCEEHKRLGSAELMDLVEARVLQLYADLKQEHDMLIRLICTVHGKYAHNKEVYAVGWDACKQRKKLEEDLRGFVESAIMYFHHCVKADEMVMTFLPVFFEFSTILGASELPTYWEGFPPARARATLLSNYLATRYSPGMLQSQWQPASQTHQLQALAAASLARRGQ